ncbi:E3 ubiquitin/ISG15 ligase TRIM25-like [Betta splendens]|uniref:E3 ubiquitin/ISG15 ligase TRIM25-like n=1 Tax=Betta splendens TaxID=158456 RepID=A0A6P7N2G4_BETSP|nr:E3 ubiquitin/ISG15 ligase TRIM25-like [Betta splendens]
MSSSKPEDQLALELTCPICLQLYSDPVVLPCGHNYCRACICRTARIYGDGVQCPECREEFQGVESLQKNFKLSSIVEGYRAAAALQGPRADTQPEVSCDHCIDERTPAVRVCLKCQVSLCCRHLQKHHEREAFRDHPLVEPLNELEVKGCVAHRRPLEYFCSNDASSLCATCVTEGRHQDHDVLAFSLAEEETRRSLEARSKVISGKLLMTQSLLQKTVEEQAASEALTDRVVSGALRVVDVMAELMNGYRERLHERLEREGNQHKKSWRHEVSELEEQQQRLLEAERDATRALSETDAFAFMHRYTRIQHKLRDAATGSVPPKVPSVAPLDINALQSGLKTQEFHSDMTRLLHSLHVLLHPLDLSFSLCTAHPNLILSNDLRTVKYSSSKQPYLEHPERFTSAPQVMCSQEFSSGEHAWVVEVGPSSTWSLGVCYRSIPRRGDSSRLGHNSMSWRLQCKSGKLTACHASSSVNVGELIACLLRVEIELNYEAGTLAFHSTKGKKERLYIFRTVFKEPVYPVFSIHSNSPESWITLHTGM